MSFFIQELGYSYVVSKAEEVALHPPLWKDKMDRWYQLDEVSRALCEAIFSWNESQKISFDQIIFVGSQGSNLADADFAAGATFSPSKFVYTLPSIAPSLISQILDWHGPVYCLGVGQQAESALLLAEKLAEKKALNFKQNTLLIQSPPELNGQGNRFVSGRLYKALKEHI